MRRDRPNWRRLGLGLVAALLGVVVTIVFVPEGNLACLNNLQEHSPDGAWTLSLCRRPMLVAMPGQTSDAPGWIVLRDAAGLIRGVSALDMVQNYGASGTPPIWDRRQVTIPLTVELPLPLARGRLHAWLEDRMWRLRALMGLTTRSEDFRYAASVYGYGWLLWMLFGTLRCLLLLDAKLPLLLTMWPAAQRTLLQAHDRRGSRKLLVPSK